jgi:hypothetical protein
VPTAVADVSASASAPAGGTYANGVLPPVFSPFTANPTGAPAAAAAPEAEPEKPAKAHHTKKAAESAETPQAPAAEK